MKKHNIDDVVWVIKNTIEADASNDNLPPRKPWRAYILSDSVVCSFREDVDGTIHLDDDSNASAYYRSRDLYDNLSEATEAYNRELAVHIEHLKDELEFLKNQFIEEKVDSQTKVD